MYTHQERSVSLLRLAYLTPIKPASRSNSLKPLYLLPAYRSSECVYHAYIYFY